MQVDKVGNQSVANFSRIDRRAKRDTDSDEASDKADSNNTDAPRGAVEGGAGDWDEVVTR